MWRELPANPLLMLFHAWNVRMNRWYARDVVVNIALYIPFGMSAFLAFGRNFFLPVAMGLALSVSVETLQIFEPGRDSNAVDVVTNVLGSIAGVGAGLLFDRLLFEQTCGPARLADLRVRDRPALMLLFLWAGYLLVPFFPVVGLYTPMQRLRVFWHAPAGAVVPLVSGMAAWFAAGKLMRAAGFRHANFWLGLSLVLIPMQLFVAGRQPLRSFLLGGITGFSLFAVAGRSRSRSVRYAAAVGFLLVLLVRGLFPFHFAAAAAAFSWIPFAGFLQSEWQQAFLTLIEKAFYYGTAVWLFLACGLRAAPATAVVTSTLLGIELAQIHLAGRTPEITDPLLAIVLAFTLRWLARETYRPLPR